MKKLTGGLMRDLLGIHTVDEVDTLVDSNPNLEDDEDSVEIPEGYKLVKDDSAPAEKVDKNGLPGDSIIDLVENKGPKAEPAKDDSKDEPKKDGTVPTEDDDVDYFEEEPKEEPKAESGSATVEAAPAITKVVIDDTSIQKGDEEDMTTGNGNNIADLMIKYDHQKLTASVAEFKASDGKIMDSRLFGIVQEAIEKNPEVRKLISTKIPELIKEFPDGIKEYQQVVFDVARNVRVKYMIRIPETGALYESMDTFFSQIATENPTMGIEYGRGLRKPQDVWVRTDVDGNIISQDKVLTEAEVRKIVLGLPKEIQDEACEKLHIPEMIVKKKTGDKKPEDKK